MAYHNQLIALCMVLMAVCANGAHSSHNRHVFEKESDRACYYEEDTDKSFDSDTSKPIGELVKLYLYTKKNPGELQELKLGDVKALKNSNFYNKRETRFVIHGYRADSQEKDGMEQTLKNALMKNGDYNIILVDWSALCWPLCWPRTAAAEMPKVGEYVAKFVGFLTKQGLPKSKVHIMGHSMGAQASGFAGKAFKRLYNTTIPRITGLDPALPCFRKALSHPDGRLDKGDADFVDVIHSDGNCLGYEVKIGHADFYPNGGDTQPGCPFVEGNNNTSNLLCVLRAPGEKEKPLNIRGFCSHSRSWQYFAESMQKSHHFYAEKCDMIRFGKPTNCKKVKGAQMGYYANRKLRGYFYLTTNGKSPYSKD